ncbi:MAG: UvrD-helicase domain-containing protein [Saprospiraceae bacterium]|nr:UvrD-helicase domain-containing protein [Saprospiraceae bacterium]
MEGSSTKQYLEGLNAAQRAAVEATDGPVMIIAGPGSGKTRVLTFRVAHLINNGVDPFRILALTFTNKAAREMRERIEKIVGNEAKNLWMGTFHSIFARILRYEAHRLNYPSNFTIYDTQDSKSLIKKIVKEMGVNEKLYKPNIVLNRISSAKNSLINAEAYAGIPELTSEDESSGRPKMAQIYREYARRCFLSGAMDFDDLLLKMHQLLDQFPDVLHKYQTRYSHVMIDEFQDTNHAQYQIVKLLSAVHENVCVVGDDAQSIYGFRGATIQNILNLNKDYPDLRTFKLEQNYRSTKHIVEAANEIIKFNKNQHAKTIWTDNHPGEKLKVVRNASDNEEGAWVAAQIFEYKMQHHIRNNDFAILYRTNAQSRAMEEALRRKNIPYRIYGGLSFYQRKEVKDMLAYLRLVVNPNDEEALRRVINFPTRGIGNASIERVTVWAKENECALWDIVANIDHFPLGTRPKNAIRDFVVKIKSFQAMQDRMDAFELAEHIAKSTGLQALLYNDKSVEGVNRFDNYQELLNSIKEFSVNDQVVEGLEDTDDRGLGAYLQSVSLLTDADNENPSADQVKLMTIHAAKGLEFEVVFVGGMEENLFPSVLSTYSREDLEEERRLFYVAVTRAKRQLYLTYATTRYKFGDLIYPEPSRFLEEIPDGSKELIGIQPQRVVEKEPKFSGLKVHKKVPERKLPQKLNIDNFEPSNVNELAVGHQVMHQRFGDGKIIGLEGEASKKMATVFFKNHGNKKLLLKFAKLMIID